MEENVALDTDKQRKFVKSIKGIKKLIKKNITENVDVIPEIKPKEAKTKKRKRPDRGLVYLSHIPHGFYEHEMTQYFKQFGRVTNARVIRSKRTGNSKGFAFVEFKEPAVAQIVAETMNNYLMGKRLIKAAYVPPEKQKTYATRKRWSRLNNPGRTQRLKQKKAINTNKDEEGDIKKARKLLSNFNKTKQRLSEMGINYDFFTPVDMPQALKDRLDQEKNSEGKDTVKKEKIPKEVKKENDAKASKDKKPAGKNSIEVVKNENTKLLKNKNAEKNVKVDTKLSKNAVKGNKAEEVTAKKDAKKVKVQEPINKKEQKQKQKKLEEANIKPPENFIKLDEDGDESDSSLDFDSDEYEKMMQEDSDADSGEDSGDDDDENDASDDDDGDDDEDESEDEVTPPPPKKGKGKFKGPVVPQPPAQKKGKKQKSTDQVKRKVPQAPPVAQKKPKFEKQTQQPLQKHLKKKRK